MAQNDGYSAPFVLQDILTQKRERQHQDLVDSLNVIETKQQLENQRLSAEALAEQRRAYAEEQRARAADFAAKQAAEQRFLSAGQKYVSGLAPDMDPSERSLHELAASDPDLMKTLISRQVTRPTNRPTSVEEYEYAKDQGYPGSFAQWQTEDANRKKVNPPSPPRDTGTYVGPAKDPATGQEIPGKHVVMQNGQLRVVETPGYGLAAKPSAAQAEKANRVPVGLGTKYATAKGKVEGSKGMIFDRQGSAATRAEAESLMQQIVSYAQSPNVKLYVRQVLEDPQAANVSTAEIVQGYQGILSPEELNEMRDILSSVRGQ